MRLIVTLFLFYYLPIGHSEEIQIWGPGLTPDKIVMPARYFYLKLPNIKNDFDHLKINIAGETNIGSCRLWMNTLNRKDGSFIVRYRLYESCSNFKIEVKFKNVHVGESPYIFEGPILHEDCNCPEKDFKLWAKSYECPEYLEQIITDMKPFHSVNMTNVLEDVLQNYNRPGSVSLCHYTIQSNELFRRCYGQHVGFNTFSDAILLSVLRKVAIPDQSFFINLGDWPVVKKGHDIIPIFSWCGSEDTNDIVLPTYDLTESSLENMGRVMLDMLSVQGNIEKEWEEKIPQAFWRGRDSSAERLQLVKIARRHASMFNVSLTNFFFFRDQEHIYGPKVPYTSFFKFFDFKYQINMDGTVAAYRFPYLLVGNSLVFKQESPYYEHFYRQLKPGIHYIPFKRDLSDLTEKIQWAIDHDEESQIVSKSGNEFARNNLMPKDVFCYYALALKEWSSRILRPITVSEGMEKVEQKDSKTKDCPCDRRSLEIKDEL